MDLQKTLDTYLTQGEQIAFMIFAEKGYTADELEGVIGFEASHRYQGALYKKQLQNIFRASAQARHDAGEIDEDDQPYKPEYNRFQARDLI